MPQDVLKLDKDPDAEHSYFSTILDHPADAVWGMLRDFNNYPAYIDGVTESIMENDKAGDEVGAVRCFIHHGNRVRQTLTGRSDEERWFTHAGCEPLSWTGEGEAAPATYENAIHVIPLTDGDQTFLEWRMDYKSEDPESLRRWKEFLDANIPIWATSVRNHLAESDIPRSRSRDVLIVGLNLKEGVAPEDYERFAREVDKPTCEREIPSITEWHVHRTEPLPGSDDKPLYDYVEVLQISSLEQLTKDLESEIVAELGAQLVDLVDEPVLLPSKQIL